ncbi:MAG: hypothetical protein LBF24_01975 [Puniceicoccales bacterium]|nr:hypothetical protein [Puniceicoccales bacterium]
MSNAPSSTPASICSNPLRVSGKPPSAQSAVSAIAIMLSVLTDVDFSSESCTPLGLDDRQQQMVKAAPMAWRVLSAVGIFFLPLIFVVGVTASIVQVVRRPKGGKDKADVEAALTRKAFFFPLAALCVPFMGVFSPTTSFRFLINRTPLLSRDVDFVVNRLGLSSPLEKYGEVRNFFFPSGVESGEIDAFMVRHLPLFISHGRYMGQFFPFLVDSLGLGEETRASAVVDRAWEKLGDGWKWDGAQPSDPRKEFLRQCGGSQRCGALLGTCLVDFLKADIQGYEAKGMVLPSLGDGFMAALEDIFSRKSLAALMAQKFAGDCAKVVAPALKVGLEDFKSGALDDYGSAIEIPNEDTLAEIFAQAIKKSSSLKTFPDDIVDAILKLNRNTISAKVQAQPAFQEKVRVAKAALGQKIVQISRRSHQFVCVKALFDYLQVRAKNVQD